MTAPVFVDTNVLLYAIDTSDPENHQAAGCRFLLTEDLSHGQDLDGLRVVSPFRARPSELDRA